MAEGLVGGVRRNDNERRDSNCDPRVPGLRAACAAFSAITLDTMGNGLTANLFRVGINYWFDYWNP